MIGTILLSTPAIALLAAGTPRQAAALFRGRLHEPRRKTCRVAGLCLLATSLCAALTGDDRARHLVSWIGAIGIEALLLALALTAETARSLRTGPRRDSPRM